MRSAGENNWWKKAIASGEIPGSIMHTRSAGIGTTLVWPWGEDPGYCPEHGETAEDFKNCNAALVKITERFLSVTAPAGNTYRFRQTARAPFGQGGNHAYGSEHQTLIKDHNELPRGISCVEHGLQGGLQMLAVREVAYRLQNGRGAERCFTSPDMLIEKIPEAPKPEPVAQEQKPSMPESTVEKPSVVAVAEPEPELEPKPEPKKEELPPAPKPKRRRRARPKAEPFVGPPAPPRAKKVAKKKPTPPLPPPAPVVPKVEPEPAAIAVLPPSLSETCQTELPDNAMDLWNEAKPATYKDVAGFSGYRCGYLYRHSQKGVSGRHTPEQRFVGNNLGDRMTLQVGNSNQVFEISKDAIGEQRLWARHSDPAQWMIPPHMSPTGHAQGEYGPIEIRLLEGGRLIFRYLIPSNDDKKYTYAWAIAQKMEKI